MKAATLSPVVKKIFKFRTLNTFAVVSFLLLFTLIILNWEFISLMQDFDDWLISIFITTGILAICFIADIILVFTIRSKKLLIFIELILLLIVIYNLKDYV